MYFSFNNIDIILMFGMFYTVFNFFGHPVYATLNFGTSYLYPMMLNLNKMSWVVYEWFKKEDKTGLLPVGVLFNSVIQKFVTGFHGKC